MKKDPSIIIVCYDGQMSALFAPLFEQEMNLKGHPCKVTSACSRKGFRGTDVFRETIAVLGYAGQELSCNSTVEWIGDLGLRDCNRILCLDVEAFAFVEDLFLERNMASKTALIPQSARWSGRHNDPRGKNLAAFEVAATAMSEVIRGTEGIVGDTIRQIRQTKASAKKQKFSR